MTLDQFLILQNELTGAFGWLARWWFILFAAGGVFLAVFLLAMQLVSSWLDRTFNR